MTALVATAGLSVSLGGRDVLSNIDLAVAGGEMVALIGPNGAGKSTLLRALAGLQRPARGAVRLNGTPLEKVPAAGQARLRAFLPQAGESHWDITVETLVMIGRLPHLARWGAPGPADTQAVARAMAETDVTALAARRVNRLSGGERARVLLARALAAEPRLLLADEPVSGLDPAHGLDVMALLRRRAGAGCAVIVVLHDLSLAARFCARVVVLDRGRVRGDGPPAEVLSPGLLAACYGIRAHFGVAEGRPYIVPVERIDDTPDR